MKKTLLAMGAALAALSIVLAGCDQPTDYTVSERIQSIQGPANVKITEHTGALQVEWDLVTDAAGYEIRRKEDVAGARYVVLTLNQYGDAMPLDDGVNEYWDAISDDNVLEGGKTYRYQVIAVSGAATRSAGEVVQSGISEAVLTVDAATFPPKATAVVKPVTAVQASVSDWGEATYSWTSTNEAPVTYAFVDYAPITSGGSSKNHSQGGIKGKQYTATGFLSGEGFLRGAVYAEWPGGYYAPSAAAELAEVAYSVDSHLIGIASPSLAATRVGSTETVTIIWVPVVGATSYVLEKYEAVGQVAGTVPADGWVTVGTEPKVTRAGYAVEDSVPLGSSAKYRLFAKKGDATANANEVYSWLASVSPAATTVSFKAASLLITADDDNIAGVASTNLDTSIHAIVFEVATVPESGETYTIFRRKVGNENGTGSTESGNWEPVTGAVDFAAGKGTLSDGDGDGIVKLQLLVTAQQRQKYIYIIKAYKDGEELNPSSGYGPIYANGNSSDATIAAKAAITISTGAIQTTTPVGETNAQTRWYGVLPTGFGGGVVNQQLISGESVYIYGRFNPNPAGTTPVNADGTILIGSATYYDSAAIGALTDTVKPTAVGYWIKGSAYYISSPSSTLTAEVK
jgi:hypothetical protein